MAGKVIKGLTVEIGGDTTKLGKALENVEQKSRNLSSELGEINRLLKVDPSNTELLAQKQKVLADAVSNTKNKLDTLRQAEQQVQAQFARGEVSEEQYRALQREIMATEKKLSGYENAAKQTADALDETAQAEKNAAQEAQEMGDKMGAAANAGLKTLATGLTAVVAALVGAAESTREYRTYMGMLETAFEEQGFSATAAKDAYTDMVGILGDADQATEATNHLAELVDTEKDLATWSGPSSENRCRWKVSRRPPMRRQKWDKSLARWRTLSTGPRPARINGMRRWAKEHRPSKPSQQPLKMALPLRMPLMLPWRKPPQSRSARLSLPRRSTASMARHLLPIRSKTPTLLPPIRPTMPGWHLWLVLALPSSQSLQT